MDAREKYFEIVRLSWECIRIGPQYEWMPFCCNVGSGEHTRIAACNIHKIVLIYRNNLFESIEVILIHLNILNKTTFTIPLKMICSR